MDVREKLPNEKRLIDANILKSAIEADGYEHFSGCLSSSEALLLEMVKDDIDETQTVDAVEVVRCRECDHKIHDGNGRPYCLQLEMYLNKNQERDFFCKYGERKDGDWNG